MHVRCFWWGLETEKDNTWDANAVAKYRKQTFSGQAVQDREIMTIVFF